MCPTDLAVSKVTQQWLSPCSVPEFLDLGGRRHPLVNSFPLSHVIFKVNFPLSNDPLALVSENPNSSAVILDFLLNQRGFPYLSI